MKTRYFKVIGNIAKPLPDRLKDESTHSLELSNAKYDSYTNADYFKVVDGKPKEKTQDELDAMFAEKAEKAKEQQKEQLWQACNRYQESKISVGGMIELKPFEGTSAKCGAIRQWIKDLWADYYTRKAQIEAGQEVSYNFDNNGDLPHTYLEAATEAGVI